MSAPKWTELDVVINQMRLIMQNLGRFPGSKLLTKNGYSSLLNAIYRYHGGMMAIREIMEQELTQKPYGYYKDMENIKAHIDEAFEYYGREPSILELDRMFPGIKRGINVHHGGYREIRDQLGFPQLSAPNGYWHQKENVNRELTRIVKDITGYFPSYYEMLDYGERGLYTGVLNCYGSIDNCQRALGFPLNPKSKLEKKVKRLLNMWVVTTVYEDNLRARLRTKYGITLKHPDTGNPLEIDRLYPNERVAIEVQGEQHEREVSLYANRDNNLKFLEQLRIDKEKRGQLPNQNVTLIEIWYDDTDEEILNKVRPYLALLSSPRHVKVEKDLFEHYQDPDIAKKALSIIIDKNPGVKFTSDFVRRNSETLYNALKEYHGGINGARRLLGIPIIRDSRGTWTLSYTVERYQHIYRKLGRAPRKKDLWGEHAELRKLYAAIMRHGGMAHFREHYYVF